MDISIKIVAYAILITIVLLFGIVGSYILGQSGQFSQNMTWVNAIYFTITTVSTVGYGDIVPITQIAKIFTGVLIVSGLGVFLSAITVLSSDFVNNRVEKISGRISSIEMRFLKEHTVLVGTGAVNVSIAKKLKKAGKRFIVVTSDKTNADRFRDLGYKAFVADPTSEIDMSEFNLNKVKSIVIDLRDVSNTVYCLLVAKSIAGDVPTMVIAQTEEVEKHLKNLGLTKEEYIINPNNIVARNLFDKMPKG